MRDRKHLHGWDVQSQPGLAVAGEPRSAANNTMEVLQHLPALLAEEAECEPPLGLGQMGMCRLGAPLPQAIGSVCYLPKEFTDLNGNYLSLPTTAIKSDINSPCQSGFPSRALTNAQGFLPPFLNFSLFLKKCVYSLLLFPYLHLSPHKIKTSELLADPG